MASRAGSPGLAERTPLQRYQAAIVAPIVAARDELDARTYSTLLEVAGAFVDRERGRVRFAVSVAAGCRSEREAVPKRVRGRRSG